MGIPIFEHSRYPCAAHAPPRTDNCLSNSHHHHTPEVLAQAGQGACRP